MSRQLVAYIKREFDKDNMSGAEDLVPHLEKGCLYNGRSVKLGPRVGSFEINP